MTMIGKHVDGPGTEVAVPVTVGLNVGSVGAQEMDTLGGQPL